MKLKRNLSIAFLLLIIGGIGYLFIGNVSLTGETILNNYIFTKAICDENNLCQDYEIHCKNGEVTAKIPIVGSERQYSNSWEDPRTQEQIERLCE
tara:strand:- start:593 stop:877 length:285 start_codon:yes stop_codon:yes gene_type:complete